MDTKKAVATFDVLYVAAAWAALMTGSSLLWWAVFAVSALLFAAASLSAGKQQKRVSGPAWHHGVWLAVLVPCLLAGRFLTAAVVGGAWAVDTFAGRG